MLGAKAVYEEIYLERKKESKKMACSPTRKYRSSYSLICAILLYFISLGSFLFISFSARGKGKGKMKLSHRDRKSRGVDRPLIAPSPGLRGFGSERFPNRGWVGCGETGVMWVRVSEWSDMYIQYTCTNSTYRRAVFLFCFLFLFIGRIGWDVINLI